MTFDPATDDDLIDRAEQLDEALRRDVEGVLDDAQVPRHVANGLRAIRTALGSPSDTKMGSSTVLSAFTERDPTTIGRFDLRERIGAGSFGVVYRAYDPILKREVALKIPRVHITLSEDLLGRFLRESEASARLHHPHIVPVFEAGSDGATAYIVAEYCPGMTLAEWLDNRTAPMAPRKAALLIAQVADAVEHAHNAGILHRDLKPGNILLVESSSDADRDDDATRKEPDIEVVTSKVADFGLARFVDEDSSTIDGALVGTVAYMAPEQAEGRTGDVDRATDVYALGVILYELLTLKRPLEGATTLDTLRRISKQMPAQPRSLRKDVPTDLSSICLKCLEKDSRRRYATCEELREDLKRYLDGRPTVARPLGPLEQALRWGRRNPELGALVTVSLLALVGLIVGQSIHNRQLSTALDERDEQQRLATAATATARAEGRRAEAGQLRALNMAYAANMRLAFDCYQRDNVAEMSRALDLCQPASDEPDLRGFAWHLLDGLRQQTTEVLEGHEGAVYSSSLSPDGAFLVTAGAGGTARIWDLKSHLCRHVLTGHTNEINKVRYSADGRWIATASDDTTVRIWDAETGEVRTVIDDHTEPVHGVDFIPGTDQIVTGSYDKTLRVWSFDGQSITELDTRNQTIEDLDVSPDGRCLAVAVGEQIRLWDLQNLEMRARGQFSLSRFATTVQFSPDSRLVAAAMRGSWIYIWDVVSGEKVTNLRGHENIVHGIDFLPDSRGLVSVGRDGTARHWTWETAASRQSSQALSSPGDSLVWSDRHQRAIVCHEDGMLTVWDGSGSTPLQVVEPLYDETVDRLPTPARLSLSTDESLLYVIDDKRQRLLTYHLSSQGLRQSAAFPLGDEGIHAICAPAAENQLLLVGKRSIWLSDGEGNADGEPLASFATDINAVDTYGDLASISMGQEPSVVHIWNLRTKKRISTISHTRQVSCLCLLPGGNTIAASDSERGLNVWDIQSGDLRESIDLRDSPFKETGVTGIELAPDQTRVATCTNRGELFVWSADDWELVDQAAVTGGLRAVCWANGQTILATTDDGRLHRWALSERIEHRRILYGDERIWSIQVSREGGQLYITDGDGRVRLVSDTESPSVIVSDILFRGADESNVVFSGDFSRVAISTISGNIQVWDLLLKRQVGEFHVPGGAERFIQCCFDASGSRLFVEGPGDAVSTWSTSSTLTKFVTSDYTVGEMAVSPDGDLLAVAWEFRNAGADLFGTRAAASLQHFETSTFDGVAFGPQTGRLWLLQTPKVIGGFEAIIGERVSALSVGDGCRGFEIAPDEQRLVTLHDGSGGTFLKLWDVQPPQRGRQLYGHTERPLAAAFSPDGRLLATVAEDGTLRLWHVQSGQQIGVLHEQVERLSAVAFSLDGRTLAAGPITTSGTDKAIRFWTVDSNSGDAI